MHLLGRAAKPSIVPSNAKTNTAAVAVTATSAATATTIINATTTTTDVLFVSALAALEGPDPHLPIPPLIFKKKIPTRSKIESHQPVLEAEFAWMEKQRPLTATAASLDTDYGPDTAQQMLEAFADHQLTHLIGTLAWPGVGTRWRQFLSWASEHRACATSPARALRGFGQALGRVTSYRALALDKAALKSILAADCIFPSGQLRVSAERLHAVVEAKGVRTVCVARLFISELKRLLGHDPSISLHDDWQTTSVIASSYASKSKQVHLFEVSVPKVESIGWTLQQVAEQRDAVLGDGAVQHHSPWFCFSSAAVPLGVWFDGRLQRTERYGLYGIPFLQKRLQRLLVFKDVGQVAQAVAPFASHQLQLHSAYNQAARQQAERELRKAFAESAPHRLSEVDALLDANRGKEEELVRTVRSLTAD